MQPRFHLKKWYLDCVTESGDTAIVYCADLTWRGIPLRYSSVLASRGEKLKTRTSMKSFEAPTYGNAVATIELPGVGVSGRWQRLAPLVSHRLLENADGNVEWSCEQPKSDVHLNIDGIGEYRGLGYCECLTLTLPPWKLPLRELRWGRFLSKADSCVWIDWQGEHQLSLVVFNGEILNPEKVSDTEIRFDRGVLQLDRGLSLRSGRLGDTVLRSAPALKLLPSSLFGIVEQKWRSRGALIGDSGETSGWAIHEVVQWK